MHENMKTKPKRGIEWSYRPWERKTLQKFRKKTTKNLSAALPSRREREKVEKLFEKDVWNSKRTVFQKPEIRCSIDRKTSSINRTRQRLTEFLKQDFDWSKIRLDQSKFWKKTAFERKTWFFEILPQSIEYKEKMHEYEMKCSPKTQVLNPIFQTFRF